MSKVTSFMIGFHNPVFGWHIIYLAVQRTNNKCMGKVIYFFKNEYLNIARGEPSNAHCLPWSWATGIICYRNLFFTGLRFSKTNKGSAFSNDVSSVLIYFKGTWSYDVISCHAMFTEVDRSDLLYTSTLVLWCQCRSVSLRCTISLCRRSSQQVHYLIMDPKRSATLPPTPSNQHTNMILWFVSW